MSSSFKFLAHQSFQENIKDFLSNNPKSQKALFVNLEKSRSNPFSGKPMHSLPKKLRQKVFRLWVGGPGDFRFIYYVGKEKSYVLGIYVSVVPRSEFSYEKSDWFEIMESIVEDLENENYDKFAQMNTQGAV